MHGFSFHNKVLPKLKDRYNSDENNLNQENEKKNDDKRIMDNNSKSIELIPPTLLNNNKIYKNKRKIIGENMFLKNGKKNYMERANKFGSFNRFNTLRMMIDKQKPFNYKGQIDIIVEE